MSTVPLTRIALSVGDEHNDLSTSHYYSSPQPEHWASADSDGVEMAATHKGHHSHHAIQVDKVDLTRAHSA